MIPGSSLPSDHKTKCGIGQFASELNVKRAVIGQLLLRKFEVFLIFLKNVQVLVLTSMINIIFLHNMLKLGSSVSWFTNLNEKAPSTHSLIVTLLFSSGK